MRSDLLALAAKLAAAAERFALVTVVRREPPSSARVGDAALVTESGEYHGWAGGGCTRETVMRESLRAIADGEPRLLSLSPSGSAGAPRAGMQLLPMACESGGTVEIYVEPVLPAPRLVLFGATPAVEALARIGDAMGYRVARAPEGPLKGAHILIATMGEEDPELRLHRDWMLNAMIARTSSFSGWAASHIGAYGYVDNHIYARNLQGGLMILDVAHPQAQIRRTEFCSRFPEWSP